MASLHKMLILHVQYIIYAFNFCVYKKVHKYLAMKMLSEKFTSAHVAFIPKSLRKRNNNGVQ